MLVSEWGGQGKSNGLAWVVTYGEIGYWPIPGVWFVWEERDKRRVIKNPRGGVWGGEGERLFQEKHLKA